ncbi:MAG TPA: histidine kinase dimerization/phosphoacceptor domain -containing protein, partial [Spirochaetota bacterium]|nr:histidine kinase dimerization/phosphoacceptor domain -containing protein [Spirochaetota bacterium]
EKARAENRYKTLVESLQEGIAIVDEKETIRYANPRFVEMTGCKTGVEGMNLFGFFKEGNICRDEFDLCIKSGEILMKDCELNSSNAANGMKRFASLTLVPFTKMGEFFTGAIIGVVDITDKKETEQRLVESIENREVLIRELYHRTKNNMQVICSLIRLRSADVSDEMSRSLFREIEGRILAMALVHEKLYESKNLSRIDIRAYTIDLAKIILSHALENGDRINVNIDIPEMAVPIDVAIPYGLMITELMTNSYKHAFPGLSTGMVNISISPAQENRVSFTYIDDGKGVGDDFDIGNQHTFGMRMIMNLVEHQLHGNAEVEGGSGFMFRAVFPCVPADRMADIRFSV